MKFLLILLGWFAGVFTAFSQTETGDITGIDTNKNTITVGGFSKPVRIYQTRSSVEVIVNKARARFTDLKVGMIVSVSTADANYATRIEVTGDRRALDLANNKKIIAFCEQNKGKIVGNGECWTLADEAFKASNLVRPTADIRVWGRVLDKKENILPGDIVEYRSAKFQNGSSTGPEHTAIVFKVEGRDKYTVAEQNWGGNKTVRLRQENKKALTEGTIVFYRPLSNDSPNP